MTWVTFKKPPVPRGIWVYMGPMGPEGSIGVHMGPSPVREREREEAMKDMDRCDR